MAADVLNLKKGSMMAEKYKKMLGITGITLAVYIGLKYLLPYVAPFLFAWIYVKMMNPVAQRMQEKLYIKKEWITIISLFVFTAIIPVAGWFLLSKLFEQVRGIVDNISIYQASFDGMIDGCCSAVEQAFGFGKADVRQFIDQIINYAVEHIQMYTLPNILNHSLEYAMTIFKVIGVFLIVIFAVILLERDYDDLHVKLRKFSGYQCISRIINRLWILAGAYLKAQGTIILIVMAICVVGFWITGNPYALLLGVVIGLLDALPFIGTGTILIPWAILCLLQRDYYHAAAYFTIFLVANTVREYLEPRLLGDKLGVYPILIALVVYAGMCIYGLAGVFLGPLTLMIVMECGKEFWGSEKLE